jgi:5-(carboxyamino)imidazole ribonucleotide synthase
MASSPPGPQSRAGVAIVGAGQLARMLASSAVQLGVDVRCLATSADEPAASIGQVTLGSHSDPAAIAALVQGVAVLTFEHEWADLEALAEHTPEDVAIRPLLATMQGIADKAVQRQRLAARSIAQPQFWICETEAELDAAMREVGTVVVKRRKGGYDGYGVAQPTTSDEARAAWLRFGRSDALVEARVDFVRELSVIVVRSADPSEPPRSYDVCESINANGRCEFVVAPARIDAGVAREARAIAAAAVDAFEGVGVFAVEMFELPDGRLLVNELAPRVHNTGHWTIEGAHTSQFENHVRAVLGWPLGDTEMCTPFVAMANVLGTRQGDARTLDLPSALVEPRVAVHLYGKKEIRPGRKLGHVTAWGGDLDDALARSRRAMRGLKA